MGPAVTVFGSARLHEESPYYAMARDAGVTLPTAQTLWAGLRERGLVLTVDESRDTVTIRRMVEGGRRADMFAPATHAAVARCFASRSCAELDALGQARDIPIHSLKDR